MCVIISALWDKDVGSSKESELKVLIKQLFGCEDKGLDTTKCFPPVCPWAAGKKGADPGLESTFPWL